jgi:hypothetical protein
MKANLRKIANTLVLYSYHIENKGFINGKMGIAFFLYHCARYTKDMEYNDFADDIVDDILATIDSVPFDFENGLTGIGWAINYLMNNAFLDGDPDEALQYVDDRVFLYANTGNIQTGLLGQGLYLLSRIKDSTIEQKHIDTAEKIINLCCAQLKENAQIISLDYLNSLLYFCIHIDKFNICQKQLEDAKNLIFEQINISLKKDIVDDSDRYALHEIMKQVEKKQKSRWKQVLELQNYNLITSDKETTIELFIKKALLNMLYFNKKLAIPSVESICQYINEKQGSLSINNFLLNNGLAALGTGLIQSDIRLSVPNRFDQHS